MNGETISGVVSDLKAVPTRTGTNMVTFVLDGKCCKAFGEIAASSQKLNDKQVEITAERGTYQGKPEYAVMSVTAIVDGRRVTVTDTRRKGPAQTASGTCPHCGAQMARRDVCPGFTEEEFEEILRRDFGESVTPEIQEPASNPASETRAPSEEAKQKCNETMIAVWIKSFSDSRVYSDRDLEKKLTDPRLPAWTREAARQVLETRKAQRIDRSAQLTDEFVRAEYVTFENLENQYKAQKAAREMEKPNQLEGHPSN